MKRLGVTEIEVGMKLQWRKGGKTSEEIHEVIGIEKTKTGKTIVKFRDSSGVESVNYNAGNRFILAEEK